MREVIIGGGAVREGQEAKGGRGRRALVTEGIERGHMKDVIIGGAVSGTEIGIGMKGGLRRGQGAKDGLEARLGRAVRNGGLRLSSVIVREEKEQNDEWARGGMVCVGSLH